MSQALIYDLRRENDKLRAINAELVVALRNLVDRMDHPGLTLSAFHTAEKINPGDSALGQARAALAKADQVTP